MTDRDGPGRTRRPPQDRPRRPPQRRDPASYVPVEDNKAVEAARGVGEWVVILVIAFVIAFVVQRFVVQTFRIPSESMTPTLQVGDRLLANKVSKHLGLVGRGDIVVFDAPPDYPDPSVDRLIKRVIAVPGDRVESRSGLVFVNGAPLQEKYLPVGTVTNMNAVTIPEGTLWVMGDNRGNSEDSRFIGPVDQDLVVGTAFFKIWPLTSIGLI